MRITLQTNYTPQTFTAKKKEIRKADDIQRQAKANFPMFSPSYLKEFYLLNNNCTDAQKQLRTVQIGQRIVYKINAAREAEHRDEKYSFLRTYRTETPFIRTLERIKKSKIGNCSEAAAATMAVLAANGYYDSKRVGLRVQGKLIDKKTQKVLSKSGQYSLDHAFVVSSMNKENPTEKDYVVLDSWMGFADSISGAKAKYQRLFHKDDKIINQIKNDFSLFRVEHFSETGEMLNWDDCEIVYNLVFEDLDNLTKDDICSLGRYTRMMYPHLCL